MIDLKKEQFLPAFIAFSILFVPGIICGIIAQFFEFNFGFLIGVLIVLFFYSVCLGISWIECNSKTKFLRLTEKSLEIINPKIDDNKEYYQVLYNNIESIEHYKITSLSGWLQIFFNVLPRYTSINYIENGKQKNKAIGYLKLKDIRKIAADHNIKLIEH